MKTKTVNKRHDVSELPMSKNTFCITTTTSSLQPNCISDCRQRQQPSSLQKEFSKYITLQQVFWHTTYMNPMHQRKNTNGHSNSQNMYSRSSAGGYGRDVEGGRRYNDTNTNILEQQNNDRISELSEQVARLKVNKNRERLRWNDVCCYRRTLTSIVLILTSLRLFFSVLKIESDRG